MTYSVRHAGSEGVKSFSQLIKIVIIHLLNKLECFSMQRGCPDFKITCSHIKSKGQKIKNMLKDVARN